jgi:hypothetical protein
MMMGIISFSIVLLEGTQFFETVFGVFMTPDMGESAHAVSERRVKVFEVVHIVVFALSIYYVIIAVVAYFLVRLTWQRWTKYENMEREKRGTILEKHIQFQNLWDSTSLIFRIINVKLLWERANNAERMNYLAVRQRFINVNGISPSFP